MSRIKKRGKKPGSFYYANTWHCGVRLRDCLKTTDRREAQRRLTELEISVERGEYQKGNIKFEKLVADFKDPSVRDEGIIQSHLLPVFTGKKVWDLDIKSFLEDISHTQSKSSLSKIRACMKRLGFEDIPIIASKLTVKRFGANDILGPEQLATVIEEYVPKKYLGFFWIAATSMLRLKDMAELRKKDVVFDGKNPGIRIVPSKTKKTNPDTLYFPMTRPLLKAFQSLKVWPLRDNDLWFPDLKRKAVTTTAKRAFVRAGHPRASFHYLRHFGACHALNNGMSPFRLQKLLHHKHISTTLIYAQYTEKALMDGSDVWDDLTAQIGHKRGVR